MEEHFSREQQLQLDQFATITSRAVNVLVQETFARFIAHDEWFKQQVQAGIDQMQREAFIQEEEYEEQMDARVERMLHLRFESAGLRSLQTM